MAVANACRVAVLATHPIHYHIQLYKRLAQVSGMDVTMLFCSRFGLSRQIDPTFGVAVQWYDQSILDGCKHKFLANPLWERGPHSVYATISPSIFIELTRNAYDALIVQGYAGITEWIAIAAAKVKSCRVLFRGETALNPGASTSSKALRWIIMRALSQSVDIFLPIGTKSKEFYLRYGIEAERLVQAPYAVDNSFFLSQARELRGRKREIRRSFGISMDIPVVLYISKLIPRKRPLDLVQAFEKLTEPAVLLMVGDGPLRAAIEDYATRRNIRTVIMAGFQKQDALSQFYAIGDIFVLPSEYEPWGLVVNEAMSFELPIMTTHGVAAAADLVGKENGVVYEPGDIDSLAAGLQRLVQHKDQREAMGKRSAEIIRNWNLDASVAGICQGIARARQ